MKTFLEALIIAGMTMIVINITIDNIRLSSRLFNLQKQYEGLRRQAGVKADPNYVCFSSRNKLKLQKMLGEDE